MASSFVSSLRPRGNLGFLLRPENFWGVITTGSVLWTLPRGPLSSPRPLWKRTQRYEQQGDASALFSDGEKKKMTSPFMKQLLSAGLAFLLIFPAVSSEAVGQQPAPSGSADNSAQGAPLP